MGCQVSRLAQDHEDGQAARSGLFRRFEDVRLLRRSESAVTVPGKRQPNDEEDGDGDETGCTTNSEHNDKEVSHHIPVNVSSIGHVKAHSLDGVSLKMVDSDEENDREDHFFGCRSPSFREYCVNYSSRELDMDDGHVEGAKKENKSIRKEGSAPPNPNEGSRTKVPKKGLKRRSFRKVLRKDGSLKNLWNSTCYNPSFSSSDHDKPQKEQGGKPTHDRRHSFHR